MTKTVPVSRSPRPSPDVIAGYGPVRPYDDSDRRQRVDAVDPTPDRPVAPKVLESLDAAFDAFGIGDGATLSFHHHLRNGDAVLNAVVEAAAQRGLRGLTIAVSSVFPVHTPLVSHIRSGVIRAIWSDYVAGPVGDAIIEGDLQTPLILQSHGGRARAIASGQLQIDAAFVAAPSADRFGAATGAFGRNACGPLGYPMVDADYAKCVVVVTDGLSDAPLTRAEIPATRVDAVVAVPTIGDANGIEFGTTLAGADPINRGIAQMAANALDAAGYLKPGFSFQTGAGSASLTAASEIGTRLCENGLRGGFLSGGITGAHVAMVREGAFEEIRNVQSFDLAAVASFRDDPWHHAMSAAEYASPIYSNAIVNKLNAMILGAAEVDTAFNVNVTLGGNGRLIGGPGGHPDAAAGADVTVVTTKTTAGGFAKIVDDVQCRTTPGIDIDLVVTEKGIAINPRRADLANSLLAAGLPVVDIEQLAVPVRQVRSKPNFGEARAILEYRDGSVIDVF